MKDKRYYVPDLEEIRAGESLICAFDVDFIEPEALLFQTGYLTIKDKKNVTTQLLLFQTHFESANYSKSVSKVKGNREEIKGKREKAGKRGKRNI
ncbi:MAG: hypothetical protein ABH886_01485, partial [Candidatus Desantisbacteria bacterium]